MPTIPQYNSNVSPDGKALPTVHYNITPEMTGEAQAKALGNSADGLQNIAVALNQINDLRDKTKVAQFNNDVEKWKQSTLLDKENGYYTKLGQDASGKSEDIMKGYDDFVQNWIDTNHVSKKSLNDINSISTSKRTNILSGVTSHDLEQTNKWAETEGKLGVENAITSAVSERNNPENIKKQVANVVQISLNQAGLQKLDAQSTQDLIKANKSTLYASVLDAKIQEGDLSAKEFFNKYKDDIDPKYHAKYIGAIKNEEDKYKARDMAKNIIASAKSEQDAITKAEAIKDVNMSDSVLSRVKQHYSQEEHFKNQAQEQALNSFYTKAVAAAQNGTALSYDDIPDSLDPDVKLSLMNYVNTKGQPETDNQIWESLYDMSVNNAQGFAKEDLNKYRGFLSDGEFKQFTKRQEEIKSGSYYTKFKDDDKMINSALKSIGLGSNSALPFKGHNKDIAYSEIRAMTREFEARKGRKITDNELQNIINSLGYKGSDGSKLYKQMEQGMREKTGFVRDVINDFSYYQSKHNGEMPSDAEKYKIIQNRLTQKVQEKKTQAQQNVNNFSYNASTMRNIAYTKAKPHEQKVLTYFADNQIPTISKQLGVRLTVTSRYRKQAGSHHSEGRAADVSMSELSVRNRIRVYEKLLTLPNVQAIGTSDPNILSHFAGNRKIVDERKYDRQHGTNHINHAHVTLINANPATPQRISSKNGYNF
jgi:hypothetical protein